MERTKLDFRGFESDEPDASVTEANLSEFRRNLPGLPSNNDANLQLKTDVVSCVAASGPLEDSSDLSREILVKSESREQATQLDLTSITTVVKKERTEKSKESRHSSRHRSSRDCRRCHERRKLKRSNVGVQCRIDKHLEKNSVPQFSLARSLHSSGRVPSWDMHKYAPLIHLEVHPNGNASVLHMYQEEIDRAGLCEKETRELAEEFLKVSGVNFTSSVKDNIFKTMLCFFLVGIQ